MYQLNKNYSVCSSALPDDERSATQQKIHPCFKSRSPHPMNKILRAFIFAALCCLFACSEKPVQQADTMFEQMTNTGISFNNKVENTKDFNIFSYRNFYNGGGAAIGDINNDGLADVFFTANMGSNKLFLNKGNWQFQDISEKAGFHNKEKWGTGVVMVDVNHDGWLDIYVCNAGYQKGIGQENELYINNKDLTFTEQAKEYGLADSSYTTHVAFFDFDLDGDLDCYMLNNSFIPVNTLNYANKRDLRAEDWPVADFLKGGGDKLFRNDNGRFVDISRQANIYGSLIGFGLGVIIGDVNHDYYPDIYVSNDFFERDYLYINQQDGTFKEDLTNWMQHTSLFSMGADICDINDDGYPDIFTTDMLPGDDFRLKTTSSFDNIDVYNLKVQQGFYQQFQHNTLQLNNRSKGFMDVCFYSGVAATDWSWGALIFDADNDALPDLFVCNGIYHDVTDQDFIDFFANDIIQKMVLTGEKEDVDGIISKMPSKPIPNKAFRNEGNLKFSDAGKQWGFETPSFSNGAAYGDLDNDGDLDMVINNVNQPAFIYKNKTNEQQKNNYIGIMLKGIGDNSFAIGSKIEIYKGTSIITREIIPSRGFQSSVDYKQIIGLGKEVVDSVIIYWPNKTFEKLIKPAINKVHIVQQSVSAEKIKTEKKNAENALLQKQDILFDKHTEDNYTDYYFERNIPEVLSTQGPHAAVADVNKDGLEDVFIGGAAGQSGQLYMQSGSGSFIKSEQPAFTQFAAFEDIAVLFLDADGDNDADLFVGSGGNNMPQGSRELQHRLYLNDGKGNFTLQLKSFPSNNDNTSVAVANDFDGDGDQDLFVGSRCVSREYGVTPTSHLYSNDGKGHFTEMPADKISGINQAGMVTGAVWANITGDNAKELIVVGAWMAPKVFEYKSNAFHEVKSNLDEMNGWWQTIAATDIDKDGYDDLIMGNIGDNFYLQASAQAPLKLWLTDFDENNTVDAVLSRSINKKDVPVFMKREITDQLPALKKQNLKHEDFAQKSIQDLFGATLLKTTQMKQINYTHSCIVYGAKTNTFKTEVLPEEVQFSSLNAVLCADINKDGNTDLLLGGNMFSFPPQFGRLDASYGQVLINHGKKQFTEVAATQSGYSLNGEVKDIKTIHGKNKEYILVLKNNDYPVLYSIKK